MVCLSIYLGLISTVLVNRTHICTFVKIYSQVFYSFDASIDEIVLLILFSEFFHCWHSLFIVFTYNCFYFHKVSSNVPSFLSSVIWVFFFSASLGKALSILLLFPIFGLIAFLYSFLKCSINFCSNHYFFPSACFRLFAYLFLLEV